MRRILRYNISGSPVLRGIVFCALLQGPLRGQLPYAVKPGWWDAAVRAVPLQNQDSLEKTYAETRRQALEKFRIPLKDWWIVGPFAAPDGLDSRHPPEQDPRIILNARFQDKDGQTTTWVNLSEARQADRQAYRHENVIYYLANEFQVENPGRVWLVPDHDDGMALWVDRRPTYRNTDSYRASHPLFTVPLQLGGGPHPLFAKLHQKGGGWAANIDIYRVDPRFVDLMALTLTLNHPDFEESLKWTDFADLLAERYVEVEDYTNAMYWQTKRFSLLGASERGDLYSWTLELIRNHPASAQPVNAFYQRIFEQNADTDPLKLEVILAHLDLQETAKNPLALRQLLTKYQTDLRRLDPDEADLRWIRLRMQEGDLAEARRRIRELVERNPEMAKDKRVRRMEDDLERLRRTTAQLPLDWDFEGTVRQAGRLAQSDPGELNRFIRSVLREKGGALIPTEDSNLFLGAHAEYQKAFSPYADTYQPALKEYMDLLTRQLNLDPAERVLQTKRISLVPAPRPGFPLSFSLPEVNAYRLPPTRGVQPLIEMDPGSRELAMEAPMFLDTFRRPAPASAAADSAGTVIQNSRSISAFQGNSLLWRRVWEPGTLGLHENRVRLHGALTPVVSGDRVFARILQDGRYVLTALDRNTGNTVWSWQEKSGVLCTDPVVWRDQVMVVTRTTGEMAQYALVFLDRHRGQPEESLTLLIGSSEHRFDRYGDSVEYDHYLPDPVVAGETLFLQTNNGVITAFDLPARAYRWSRRYPNASWNEYPRIRQLEDRWTHPPAVVNGVAVFGPLDSKSLIAVNAATGELLAQEGTIDWLSVHPFGDFVMVLDREQNVQLLDPLTLSLSTTLPGTGYRVLQTMEGGAVLERNGSLELWSAAPLKLLDRQALPPGWRPFAAGPRSVLFHNPNSLRPVVAVGTSAPGTNGRPVPPENTPEISRVENGFFQKGKEALYLISEAAVQKWTEPGAPAWTVPTVFYRDLKQVQVIEADPLVYLVGPRRVWILRSDSGEVLDRFPRPGEEWGSIQAPVLEKDILMFAHGRGWQDREGYDIVLLRGGETRVVGRVDRKHGTPVVIGNLGTRVVTETNDKLLKLRRESGAGEWEVTEEVKLEYDKWRNFTVTDNGRRISTDPDRVLVVNPDSGIQTHKTHSWKKENMSRRPVYDYNRVDGPLLTWNIRPEAWNAFNLDQNRDLTEELDSDTRPVAIRGKVIGMKFDPHRKARRLIPRIVDLKTGAVTTAPKINVSDTRRDWREIWTERLTFERNGKVYSLLEQAGENDYTDDNPLVIFDPQNNQATVKGFPDTGEIRDVQVWKDQVWITREHDLLRLSFQEIDSLAAGSQPLTGPLPLPVGFRLDGVPAEWGPKAVAGQDVGVFAYYDENHLYLAGTIRNPEFIRALGRNGLDKRATLHLRNGPAASFDMNKGIDLSFPALLEGAEIAYTVHPSGEHMFYEIAIPSQGLKEASFFPMKVRDQPAREFRGDFAYDLSIPGPNGGRVFGHAERPWPVWFPRFLLGKQDP